MRSALVLLTLAAVAQSAAAETGFTVSGGGGINVDAPFVEAQLGRRFVRASYLELYLDYSYDRPVSIFSFQTFGVGVRSYFARRGRLEFFHQALAGFVVSSSGQGPVQDRPIGHRLLGPIFTQGVGAQVVLHRCWSAAVVVSTGYPVWLRPELTVKYTF